MSKIWMQILEIQVNSKGSAAVARELGVSATTISLVRSDKYGASTEHIERRIIAIYGSETGVNCPVLGQIKPSRCVTNWERAKKIGVGVSNPAKIRLYKTCLKCNLRNN